MAASKLIGIVDMGRGDNELNYLHSGAEDSLMRFHSVCIYPVEKTEVKLISVFFNFQNHWWVDHSVLPTSQDEIYFM